MAIDNPSQDVELRLEVVDNIVAAIKRLDDYNERLGEADKRAVKLAGSMRKGMSEFQGVGKSADAAGNALKGVTAQTPGITALGESATKAGGAFGRIADSELPRLRYALYDVGRTATVTALAVTALGTAMFAASASFESAFTGVERTIDPAYQAVEGLRQELLQMSRESPKSFVDLAAIATLGNQLGVAGEDVAEFTDLVSKFSTVSGMTAEASAQAFGRLQNILGLETVEEVSRLASAIELVGVSSASTDQEIIALAQRLGATAKRAGFTADQVVGLSGALGSLGVAPERAQGVFETYFNSLNESLSEGGKKLEAFSAITGTTVDELQTLVRTGEGFEVFQRFLSGLQGGDTVQLTEALSELGLSGLRANEVIGRISGNLPLLQQAFATAAKGSAENTELNRQYALVLDDLSSKWKILVNGALEFAATIGTAVAPAAKVFLDIITELLHGLTDFINTPIGAALARNAALFAVVTVAIAGTVGTLAIFGASMAAVRTAIVALGLQAFVARLGAVGAALLGTSKAAWAASTNLGRLRIAMVAVGRATVILALLQAVTEALFNMKGAGDFVIDVFVGIGRSIVAAARIASDFIGALPGGGIFKEWAGGLQTAFDEMGNFSRDAHKEWGNFADDMGWVTDEVDEFSDGAFEATDAGYGLGGSLDDLGDSAESAAAKVRTLVDYASDLQGVFTRAFDIRFGGAQGFDTITTGWTTIRDAAEAAAQAARDHQNALAGLSADRSIKEYWLSVAEMYGDELRAAQLRADLAAINAKVADTSKDLATEQQKASMTLVGNTAAAVANRASLLGLVGNYGQYLQALAASGMSQAELQAQSATLKNEFIAQATQMGFSSDAVLGYAASFDDMSIAIANVPRDITVNADVNPAVQALNEFFAQAASNAYSAGQTAGQNYGNGLTSGVAYTWKNPFATAFPGAGPGIKKPGSNPFGGSWASGGYTGGGSASKVAGAVHGKEFVFSAPATRNIGVGTLSNLHQAAKSGRPVMTGNSGPGGPTGPMRLDNWTIQALASAIAPATFLDGQRISNNVGMHNATSTALGAS